MVRKLMAVLALSSGLALAGCNTIAGLGEDVESVGSATENCAEGRTC